VSNCANSSSAAASVYFQKLLSIDPLLLMSHPCRCTSASAFPKQLSGDEKKLIEQLKELQSKARVGSIQVLASRAQETRLERSTSESSGAAGTLIHQGTKCLPGSGPTAKRPSAKWCCGKGSCTCVDSLLYNKSYAAIDAGHLCSGDGAGRVGARPGM